MDMLIKVLIADAFGLAAVAFLIALLAGCYSEVAVARRQGWSA